MPANMFSQQSTPLSDQAFAGAGFWLPSNENTLNMTGSSTLNDMWSDFTIDQSLIPGAWEDPLPLDSQASYSGYQPTQHPNSIPQQPCGEDGGDSSDNGRKKRRRIPLDAKKLLDESFEQHKDDPYAPVDEIKALSSRTGLSVKQVRTYFANARARRLPPVSTSKDGSRNLGRQKSRSNAGSIPNSSSSTKVDIPGSQDGEQDPMQRFLSVSPEDEGLSEDAVRQAAEAMSPESPLQSPSTLRRHSMKADAMSVDSGASSNSGGESSGSQASVDSVNSRGRRRGRKRQREPKAEVIYSLARKPTDSHKIFQCTFCTKEFSQKYDWKRHEESVHFPQQEWICMPDGATYTNSNGVEHCAFCDSESTCDSHLSTHNHTACATAPRSRRTFLRKDKLIQHLIQVHRYGHLSKSIQTWCRPIERTVVIICGLCCMNLPDWSTRVDHLAAHFTEGTTMQFWLLSPGGITPVPDGLQETFSEIFNIQPAENGMCACHVCSERFESAPDIIAHKRQKHKIFSQIDHSLMRNSEGICSRSRTSQDDLLARLLKDIFAGGQPSASHSAKASVEEQENTSNSVRPPTPIAKPVSAVPAAKVVTPANNIVASSSQSLVARPQADWSGFYRNSPASAQSRVFLRNAQLEKIRQGRSALRTVSTPAMGVLHTMEQLPASLSMEVVDPFLEDNNASPQNKASSDSSGSPSLAGIAGSSTSPRHLLNKRCSRLADGVEEDSISGIPLHSPLPFNHPGPRSNMFTNTQDDVATPGGGTMGMGALLEEARRGGHTRLESQADNVQMLDNEAWLN